MAEWIIGLMPAHRIYVEPFGGAGSVLLRKAPARMEVYNDLDEEVVNVFRVIRDERAFRELRRRLNLTPFARSEFELCYRPCRNRIERARRTLIRGWFAFGGRYKHRSGFKPAYITEDHQKYPAGEWQTWLMHFDVFAERLRNVTVECRPAIEVMERWDRKDALHYVDPPYVQSCRDFNEGGLHHYHFEMSDEEHVELARALRGLKGMVMVSGYDSDLYRELYKGWERRVKRASALNGKERFRTEVLWMNDACAGACTNYDLRFTIEEGA
jgi:DNA adenine methylase